MGSQRSIWSFSSLLLAAVVLVAAYFARNCNPALFHFDTFVRDWYTLREVFEKHGATANRLRSDLHLYDLSVDYLVSWRGLATVFWWTLTHGWLSLAGSTEGNHALIQFYARPHVPRALNVSNPTKWKFHGLETRPWPDTLLAPWIRASLEGNASLIAREYADKIEADLINHPDMQTEVKAGQWDWTHIYGVGGLNEAVARQIPLTMSVVERLPLNRQFGFAFFSRLSSGTYVEPHTGSTNLRYRIQLTLAIDPQDSSNPNNYLMCGGERRPWIKNKMMVFDDSHVHSAKFHGRAPRVVLIIDLWHPGLTLEERDILSHPIFGRFARLAKA